MRIHDILSASAVTISLRARDKRAALEELVDLLSADAAIAPRRQEILDALDARERLMTTAIGRGVAVPHAELATPVRAVAAAGISHEGIDFGAPDGKPVHILCMMVVSRAESHERITALSALSRMMRKESVRAEIRGAKTPDDVVAIVRREADAGEGATG
ncbi:MAG: PTS sugar transporter subunit IIA [bacterium]